jgi:hypothetical protein
MKRMYGINVLFTKNNKKQGKKEMHYMPREYPCNSAPAHQTFQVHHQESFDFKKM